MRPVFLALVAACLSGAGCSTIADLKPIRSASRTILAVRQQQQEAMLCVPTSAAMIMAFYGDPHSPREIKTLSAGKFYDPNAPFDDFTITDYDAAVRAAGALGYAWVQRTFADTDGGFEEGLALIESELRAGHPVLVDATLPSGHTFVIRGFDVIAHQLFVVDPDRPAPADSTISFGDFKSIWNEHAYNHDIRAMIVTRPKYRFQGLGAMKASGWAGFRRRRKLQCRHGIVKGQS